MAPNIQNTEDGALGISADEGVRNGRGFGAQTNPLFLTPPPKSSALSVPPSLVPNPRPRPIEALAHSATDRGLTYKERGGGLGLLTPPPLPQTYKHGLPPHPFHIQGPSRAPLEPPPQVIRWAMCRARPCGERRVARWTPPTARRAAPSEPPPPVTDHTCSGRVALCCRGRGLR